MNVMYKCYCQDKEREICVPDRVPNTDILAWMDIVRQCIGYDHTAASPTCTAVSMEYAKIPVSEASAGIGEKPVVN